MGHETEWGSQEQVFVEADFRGWAGAVVAGMTSLAGVVGEEREESKRACSCLAEIRCIGGVKEE